MVDCANIIIPKCVREDGNQSSEAGSLISTQVTEGGNFEFIEIGVYMCLIWGGS